MDEETRRHLNRIEATLSRIESSHSEGREEVDKVARGVGRLANIIREERDEDEGRLDKIAKKMTELYELVDEKIYHLLKDLPEDTFKAVEKKIYELRRERHEALQAGISNEPAPLPPAPLHRDPTGRIVALGSENSTRFQRVDEREPVSDDKALTPGQQRYLWGWLVRQWAWVKYTVPAGIWEGLKHAIDAIRHLGH